MFEWLVGYCLFLVSYSVNITKHLPCVRSCVGARNTELAKTITSMVEFSDYRPLPGSVAQDILLSSKELPGLFKRASWGKGAMWVGQGGLAFTGALHSSTSKGIHLRLLDWDSLKIWYSLPQHCPLGIHTTMTTLRNMLLQTRLISLFSPIATLPSTAGARGSFPTVLHHALHNTDSSSFWP